MSSVSVLAPCGRRHNIKVTPNSTLLQVLEDVCKKSGLSPDEYDIRHYNKILDLTTLIRFSGLPNNAQLELVPAKILRQDSKVHIALQVGDNIGRVTADFWPSDTLLNVIQTLSPEIASSSDKIIVVIYMRSEIIGIDNLKNTQLKTLGLTRGSAALRVTLRDDALPLEQKVSGSGISSRPFQRDERSKKEVPVSQQNVDLNSYQNQNIPDRMESDTSNSAENLTLTSNDRLQNQLKECQTKEKSQTCVSSPKITNTVQNENKDIVIPEPINQMEVGEENIQYIGERNALIFNLSDGASSAITEELPDDFFDLTIDDYRILSRDYKRTVKEMDNVPLQTSAQRELQQSKQVLNMLHYKTTVIRIQFPDRTVIQGGFTPVETVSQVMEFVRQFLQVPDVEFYLCNSGTSKSNS
uniref:TUG ubiquitin-like domain-containing protein n=1 Tax=Clastoptera arizonana TaxID=38151 RepID=A0A1B6DRQ2_9HEMI